MDIKCVNNLKQLALGVHMYAVDNDDATPETEVSPYCWAGHYGSSEIVYIDSIGRLFEGGYIGNYQVGDARPDTKPELLTCAFDQWTLTTDWNYSSYLYLGGTPTNTFVATKVYGLDGVVHSRAKLSNDPKLVLLKDNSYQCFTAANGWRFTWHPDEKFNAAYCDGHVEGKNISRSYKSENVVSYINQYFPYLLEIN